MKTNLTYAAWPGDDLAGEARRFMQMVCTGEYVLSPAELALSRRLGAMIERARAEANRPPLLLAAPQRARAIGPEG
jgi:hypothetical protein